MGCRGFSSWLVLVALAMLTCCGANILTGELKSFIPVAHDNIFLSPASLSNVPPSPPSPLPQPPPPPLTPLIGPLSTVSVATLRELFVVLVLNITETMVTDSFTAFAVGYEIAALRTGVVATWTMSSLTDNNLQVVYLGADLAFHEGRDAAFGVLGTRDNSPNTINAFMLFSLNCTAAATCSIRTWPLDMPYPRALNVDVVLVLEPSTDANVVVVYVHIPLFQGALTIDIVKCVLQYSDASAVPDENSRCKGTTFAQLTSPSGVAGNGALVNNPLDGLAWLVTSEPARGEFRLQQLVPAASDLPLFDPAVFVAVLSPPDGQTSAFFANAQWTEPNGRIPDYRFPFVFTSARLSGMGVQLMLLVGRKAEPNVDCVSRVDWTLWVCRALDAARECTPLPFLLTAPGPELAMAPNMCSSTVPKLAVDPLSEQLHVIYVSSAAMPGTLGRPSMTYVDLVFEIDFSSSAIVRSATANEYFAVRTSVTTDDQVDGRRLSAVLSSTALHIAAAPTHANGTTPYLPFVVFVPTQDCSIGYQSIERRALVCPACATGEFGLLRDGSHICNTCPVRTTTYAFPALSVQNCTSVPGFTFDSESGEIIACPEPATERCPGNNMCGAIYTGRGCADCSLGYYPFNARCSKCPNNAALRVFLFSLAALLLVVLALFISFKINAPAKLKTARRRWSNHLGIVSIVLSYGQLLAVMGQMRVGWPPALQAVFDALSVLNFNLDLVAAECSSAATKTSFNFTTKFAVTVLIPFLVAPLLALVAGPLIVLRLVFGVGPNLQVRTVFGAFVMLMTFAYVMILSRVIQVFDCSRVADSTSTLDAEPSMVCFSSARWRTLAAFSVISIVVYGICAPGAVLVFLYRQRASLDDQTGFTWAVFATLYKRYRSRWYFWEIVTTARKLLIVGTTILLTKTVPAQIALLLLLYLLSLALQGAVKPYAERAHMILDIGLHVSAVVCLFAAIVFFTSRVARNDRPPLLSVLMILVIVGSLLFALGVVVYAALTARKMPDSQASPQQSQAERKARAVETEEVVLENLADN